MAFPITSGVQKKAQKAVIYGPEGIGKSTMAARFPGALFIDTEGSTAGMNVDRLPAPASWSMLMDEVRYVRDNPSLCRTLVLDTADWAAQLSTAGMNVDRLPAPASWSMLMDEVRYVRDNPSLCRTLVLDTADWAAQLCTRHICEKADKKGIEDFGYGKGYVYVAEEFGRLLNLLQEVADRGVHVVLTAHAKIRKFEQPDEMGAYDRWELKLAGKEEKSLSALVKEWADLVLFANYKTYSVAVDDKGQKRKAQGGARVMYTTHHPCWDAKNRHGLSDELPFDYSAIAHIFDGAVPFATAAAAGVTPAAQPAGAANTPPAPQPDPAPSQMELTPPAAQPPVMVEDDLPRHTPPQTQTDGLRKDADWQQQRQAQLEGEGIPKALAQLMAQNQVDPDEIQAPQTQTDGLRKDADWQQQRQAQLEGEGIPKALAQLMAQNQVDPDEIQAVVGATDGLRKDADWQQQRQAQLEGEGIPKALAQLMAQNQVDPDEIQAVVGAKGYYPVDTPIHVYAPGFIQGVLVGAWSSVFDAVVKNRDVPF